MKSFIGALQIVFITLKLAKVITWSWWIVLIPSFFVLFLVILLILLTWYAKS